MFKYSCILFIAKVVVAPILTRSLWPNTLSYTSEPILFKAFANTIPPAEPAAAPTGPPAKNPITLPTATPEISLPSEIKFLILSWFTKLTHP